MKAVGGALYVIASLRFSLPTSIISRWADGTQLTVVVVIRSGSSSLERTLVRPDSGNAWMA